MQALGGGEVNGNIGPCAHTACIPTAAAAVMVMVPPRSPRTERVKYSSQCSVWLDDPIAFQPKIVPQYHIDDQGKYTSYNLGTYTRTELKRASTAGDSMTEESMVEELKTSRLSQNIIGEDKMLGRKRRS